MQQGDAAGGALSGTYPNPTLSGGAIAPGSTNYIQITSTLQPGSTFYASSGTVNLFLMVNSTFEAVNTNGGAIGAMFDKVSNNGRLTLAGGGGQYSISRQSIGGDASAYGMVSDNTMYFQSQTGWPIILAPASGVHIGGSGNVTDELVVEGTTTINGPLNATSSGTVTGQLTVGPHGGGSLLLDSILTVDRPDLSPGAFTTRAGLSFDPTSSIPSLSITNNAGVAADTRISFIDANNSNTEYGRISFPPVNSGSGSIQISTCANCTLERQISFGSGGITLLDHLSNQIMNADTGRLQIYGNTKLTFQNAALTHQIGFQSPTSFNTDPVWTLPSVDGSNGQPLTTNGGGILSFGNISSFSLSAATGAVTVVAGNFGENISSITSSATNIPATTQYGDLLSIALSSGAWLVTYQACEQANGATITTGGVIGISTTTGNSSALLVEANNEMILPLATTTDGCGTIANYLMVFNTAKTVYAKFEDVYSLGQPLMLGRISAIRAY